MDDESKDDALLPAEPARRGTAAADDERRQAEAEEEENKGQAEDAQRRAAANAAKVAALVAQTAAEAAQRSAAEAEQRRVEAEQRSAEAEQRRAEAEQRRAEAAEAARRRARQRLEFGAGTEPEYAPVGYRMEGERVFAKNGRPLRSPVEFSTMTPARGVDFAGKERRVPVAQDLTGMTHFRFYNTFPFIAKRFSRTQRVLLVTRSLPRTPGAKFLQVPRLPLEIDGVLYAITRTLFVGRSRVGFVTITPQEDLE